MVTHWAVDDAAGHREIQIVAPPRPGQDRVPLRGLARNFQLDDEKVDERIRWWQKAGLTDQDGTMIEAAQKVMGTADLDSLKPVLLSIDTAAVRVRRVLGQLIDSERKTIPISPVDSVASFQVGARTPCATPHRSKSANRTQSINEPTSGRSARSCTSSSPEYPFTRRRRLRGCSP